MGLPLDVEAILIIEADGFDKDGVQSEIDAVAQICRTRGATEVRVAESEKQRAELWKARRSVSPSLRFVTASGGSAACAQTVEPASKPTSRAAATVMGFTDKGSASRWCVLADQPAGSAVRPAPDTFLGNVGGRGQGPGPDVEQGMARRTRST